jgi:hypothetical protein
MMSIFQVNLWKIAFLYENFKAFFIILDCFLNILFFLRGTMPQKQTYHSCLAHPMYPELYKCNSRESTFVEFCVDGINLFVENNFIDSLGPGRDSNPDPSALRHRLP